MRMQARSIAVDAAPGGQDSGLRRVEPLCLGIKGITEAWTNRKIQVQRCFSLQVQAGNIRKGTTRRCRWVICVTNRKWNGRQNRGALLSPIPADEDDRDRPRGCSG